MLAQRIEPKPVALTGRVVRLEPLSEAHAPDLAAVGQDAAIWAYMPYAPVRSEADMRALVRDLLARQARGTDLAFAVVHLATGRAIGASRYLNIEPAHRGLEIGGSWYGRAYQRTAVNTEAKYLLLSHAFDQLACLRVQFKSDVRNERSQRAIERLGAVREGVLRHHMIMPDGHVRDSVFYSILAEEWPGVKARLEGMLARE
jgi:RimJ/RimL family protein N-acetyltransferase